MNTAAGCESMSIALKLQYYSMRVGTESQYCNCVLVYEYCIDNENESTSYSESRYCN